MTTLHAPSRIALKNILLTTDFTRASGAALPYAQAFIKLYGATLVVAHVVQSEPHRMMVLDRLPAQDDQALEDARMKLLEFAQLEGLERKDYQPRVKQGELDVVVEELIQENEIDLVVLGTHGRRGLKKLVMGSGAETIYRTATCPVLTIGPAARPLDGGPWKIQRILFPVDLSEGTAPALPFALSLAEENEAALILLNAQPMVPWQHRPSVEHSARERMIGMIPAEAADWCQPEAVVRWEDAPEAIEQYAAQEAIDLVVMGVKRTDSARLSSHRPWPVACEVVSRAPCPVLTVRI